MASSRDEPKHRELHPEETFRLIRDGQRDRDEEHRDEQRKRLRGAVSELLRLRDDADLNRDRDEQQTGQAGRSATGNRRECAPVLQRDASVSRGSRANLLPGRAQRLVSSLPTDAGGVRPSIVSAAVRTMAQPRWAAARSAPELVGRREELAALEDELSRAEEGSFRLVLLVGEAGVGKSRLGRELLARRREATGLVAQGYPLAASAAFGLWTEAIDPFLQTLPDAEVVELCEGLLDDLASLFRRVALIRGALPERDPPLPRLLQGLAGLLGNVARRTPLAVLLDDVHFADPSSWEALRYFARHLDDARLLVIA